MKETPQRLRSFAPPTRDKIFIWSAVIAGCGIMALLGRHAAITRFGTDEFTGNVLFAVFLVLTIGLYFGFQSVIEDVFKRLQSLFRRREVMTIAETANGRPHRRFVAHPILCGVLCRPEKLCGLQSLRARTHSSIRFPHTNQDEHER